MNRHPNLGQKINETTFDHLLSFLSKLGQAAVYRKVLDNPAITGFILFRRNELGADPMFALMPYGPRCESFKSVEDARGIALGGPGVPLTDPRYAINYAIVPDFTPAHIEKRIFDLIAQGYEELPCVWVGREKNNGLWLNDRLATRDGKRAVVITTGDKGDEFLFCDEEFYSDTKEDDQTSPNYGYRKNHDKWFWASLRFMFERGYTIMESRDGMPFARLVASKKDDNV